MRGSSGSPSILCLVRTLAPFPVGFRFPYPALDHLRIPLPYGGRFYGRKGYGISRRIIVGMREVGQSESGE